MASVTLALGKGLTAPFSTHTGVYNVFGHGFNPPGYSNFNDWESSRSAISLSINNPANSFDCAGLSAGHEVCLAYVRIDGPWGGGTLGNDWYHPDGTLFFSFRNSSDPVGSGSWIYAFSYIGIKHDRFGSKEIDQDSTLGYHIYSKVTGESDQIINISMSNVNTTSLTLHSSDIGSFWVEGENLCFISDQGYKHTIANDGSSYGSVGASNAGSIWVPNVSGAYYLEFVGASGTKRRTKVGDIRSWNNLGGLPFRTSSANAGYIWTESGFWDTCLLFVAHDGWIVRISNGYTLGNDY